MAAHTKKLINSPETCVDDSIDGYLKWNPNVVRVGREKIVVRADLEEHKKQGKVCVLSGGGSGHEPIFLGYIGRGMLTGAVHGAVFAAPGSPSILTALKLLGAQHEAGVLVLFNNYTGDRLNFGMAIERAKTGNIKVETAILGEDCAGCGTTATGRRGLVGCVMLWKIAGAMAEEGKSLSEIKHFIEEVATHIGTMGVCWYPCSLPGSAPMFDLGPSNMEFGMGLHGEAGWQRVKMGTAKDAVSQIIEHMTVDPTNDARMQLNKGDTVAVLLNNLGATSEMEMNIAMKEVAQYLEYRQVTVAGIFLGRFGTSLEMAGISITILVLKERYLEYLEADCSVTHWQAKPIKQIGTKPNFDKYLDATTVSHVETTYTVSEEEQTLIKRLLTAACSALEASEEELNQLDAAAGDGDTGSTMKAGAQAIKKKLEEGSLPLSNPCHLLLELSSLCESRMGGTSGALYSIFLAAASKELKNDCTFPSWIAALEAGINSITKHGQAQPGDRSMVDPLYAANSVLKTTGKTTDQNTLLKKALEAAKEQAKATATMKPAVGRSVYLDPNLLTQQDPGATAVSVWLEAMYKAYTDAALVI